MHNLMFTFIYPISSLQICKQKQCWKVCLNIDAVKYVNNKYSGAVSKIKPGNKQILEKLEEKVHCFDWYHRRQLFIHSFVSWNVNMQMLTLSNPVCLKDWNQSLLIQSVYQTVLMI